MAEAREDRLIAAVEGLRSDVARVALSLEALVRRSAVADGAPRVLCSHPRPGADPTAPVNLHHEDTLFVNLQLLGDEASTVGPVAVRAGDVEVYGLVRQGSALVESSQVAPGEFVAVEVEVSGELRGPLTATPQQPLELRVRLSPGSHPGPTVAVTPLRPAGMMNSRRGWLPHDAYDVPEAALTP